MAQLAVAAAGAAVGSLFGAPQVGWLVGSFIGSQLFAEKQKVEDLVNERVRRQLRCIAFLAFAGAHSDRTLTRSLFR